MSAVGDVLDRKDRPAFVRFERKAVEDKAESLKAGHFVGKDVDYAYITPPYSKDVMIFKVPFWLEQLKRDCAHGRIPQDWVDNYQKQYDAWKRGEELPPNGIPIKGWGVLSVAQQETLIRMQILTVEDLANINDEGIKRIGMGGVELKHKAQGWLSQLKDKGPLTQEVAAVKTENNNLKNQVANLTKQVEALMAASRVDRQAEEPQAAGITANDLVDEEPTREELAALYKQKHGKAPHSNINLETLKERVK